MMPGRTRDPIVCLVTDRRRAPGGSLDGLVTMAAAAAAAGVHLVQVREPDLEAVTLLALTRRMVDATTGTGAVILVNDRPDVAIAAGAGGVHLRGDSVPASRLRAVAPPRFLIGQSVRDLAGAVAARPAVDYLIFGTVYQTRSKSADWPLAGIDGLRVVCRAVEVPVLAIGGITASRAGDVAAAGAAGIAGIGLFTDAAAGTNGGESAAMRAVVAAVRDQFRRLAPHSSSHGSRLPISPD